MMCSSRDASGFVKQGNKMGRKTVSMDSQKHNSGKKFRGVND